MRSSATARAGSRSKRPERRSRAAGVPLACAILLLLGSGGASPARSQTSEYPIFTVDHLHEAMKTVGLAVQLTRASVLKDDAETAKDYLIRARDQLATTVTFWRDRRKDDAVTILRQTLKHLDALDAALSAQPPDGAAARARLADIDRGCESCHAKYREQDPATREFRVKPELLR